LKKKLAPGRNDQAGKEGPAFPERGKDLKEFRIRKA